MSSNPNLRWFWTNLGVSGSYPGSITEIKYFGFTLSHTAGKSLREQTIIIIKKGGYKPPFKDIDNNIKYIRSIAPHANPNKLLIKLFEKKLNIEGEITKSFEKYPYTQTYDCSSNFAPITLFNYEEMINFKWKRELNERVR